MRSLLTGIKEAAFNSLKQHILPVSLLAVITFAVYGQSLGHDFLTDWDDNIYVTANEAVRGFTQGHLKSAFTSFYAGNYAPVQIISYMLDYSIWGMKAAGFVFTNILLHVLNGLLFYTLVFRVAGRKLWAFLAAFIFLLHPVQVESVAWISQRKNLLAMFFFLVSFLYYLGFCSKGRGKGKSPYVASVTSFVLALLAKAVAVILPAALFLYDICCGGNRKSRKHLADKIPYVAAAVIIFLVTLKSQTPELGGGKVGYHGGTLLTTLFTMLPVLVRYLALLFWPSDLSAVYAPPVKTEIDGAVVLSALLLALLCAGGLYLYRRRRDLFFWGALFFVGLLPVSQIVPLVTLMNDRYLYFPMLGGAAFVAGIAVSGWDALAGTSRKGVAAAVCLLLLLSLPVLSFERVRVWRNSLTLWTDAVGKDPGSALACLALAVAYHRDGKLPAARTYYERALSLDPVSLDVLQNISIFYQHTGEYEKARLYLLRLTGNYPQFGNGFVLLGNFLTATGDLKGAEHAYRRALSLDPESGIARDGLERIYLRPHS